MKQYLGLLLLALSVCRHTHIQAVNHLVTWTGEGCNDKCIAAGGFPCGNLIKDCCDSKDRCRGLIWKECDEGHHIAINCLKQSPVLTNIKQKLEKTPLKTPHSPQSTIVTANLTSSQKQSQTLAPVNNNKTTDQPQTDETKQQLGKDNFKPNQKISTEDPKNSPSKPQQSEMQDKIVQPIKTQPMDQKAALQQQPDVKQIKPLEVNEPPLKQSKESQTTSKEPAAESANKQTVKIQKIQVANSKQPRGELTLPPKQPGLQHVEQPKKPSQVLAKDKSQKEKDVLVEQYPPGKQPTPRDQQPKQQLTFKQQKQQKNIADPPKIDNQTTDVKDTPKIVGKTAQTRQTNVLKSDTKVTKVTEVTHKELPKQALDVSFHKTPHSISKLATSH